MTTLRLIGCLEVIVCLCLTQNYCAAQDKSKAQLGKVTPADFVLPASPLIDSSTNAVILSDIGSLSFVGNKHAWFSYVFKRQTRIKILNKKAFGDLATIRIHLYKKDDDPEMVDNISASTYNLENGQVVETKLDKKDIFEDRLDKNRFLKKFTLPAVKEGSIIEYTYIKTSPFNVNLPTWQFQWEAYPCLWSEHEVTIPQTLFYIVVRQGVHAYAVDKGSEGHESYKLSRRPEPGSMGGERDDMVVAANTIIHHWVMKDIPAFREERYLSAPSNYLDKIDFQLAKTYNGDEFHDYKNSWKQATEELMKQDDFGATLDDDNELISEKATEITTGSADPLAQAKSIYYYVNGHFTCDDHYDIYLRTNLRDVMKKNGGSVGDINLLLIALLRKKGLRADPVVLSTREYGFNLASYPVLQKLNYVIARLKIDDKVYYLDAAHSQLGFGQLAGDCYNGHARIISNRDSGSVYFETDSLKEKTTTMVLIVNTDKGMEGSWQSTLGREESFELRRKQSGKDEKDYFKNIQTGFGEDMEISDGGIDSLLKPEDPVKVHYEFRMHQAAGESRLYLNPIIGEGLHENPFKAEERRYPVEMPYVMDNMYIFSLEIPEGYTVEELPKSAKVALNGDQGLFEYLLGQQGNIVQLRCHLRLNKANFSPDDYTNLRDFFGFIVKKESETIVLKKK
jgi:hypothetical protein